MNAALAMAACYAPPRRETGFLPFLVGVVAWGLGALKVGLASSAGASVITGLSFAVDSYFVANLINSGPLDGTDDEQAAWATLPVPAWARPLYLQRVAELRAHAQTLSGLERSRLLAGAGIVADHLETQPIAATEASLAWLERRAFGRIKPGISSVWRNLGAGLIAAASGAWLGPAGLAAASISPGAAAYGASEDLADLPRDTTAPTAPATASATPADEPTPTTSAGASLAEARPFARVAWVLGAPLAAAAAVTLWTRSRRHGRA
jgi:hypothetical protein